MAGEEESPPKAAEKGYGYAVRENDKEDWVNSPNGLADWQEAKKKVYIGKRDIFRDIEKTLRKKGITDEKDPRLKKYVIQTGRVRKQDEEKGQDEEALSYDGLVLNKKFTFQGPAGERPRDTLFTILTKGIGMNIRTAFEVFGKMVDGEAINSNTGKSEFIDVDKWIAGQDSITLKRGAKRTDGGVDPAYLVFTRGGIDYKIVNGVNPATGV